MRSLKLFSIIVIYLAHLKPISLLGVMDFLFYLEQKCRIAGYYFPCIVTYKGVADALVKAIISHAKNRVIQLYATVVTINHADLRLYEKKGFKVYGTEPRSLNVGNQFYDEHMLILVFKDND